jgi:hypothetical protein
MIKSLKADLILLLLTVTIAVALPIPDRARR